MRDRSATPKTRANRGGIERFALDSPPGGACGAGGSRLAVGEDLRYFRANPLDDGRERHEIGLGGGGTESLHGERRGELGIGAQFSTTFPMQGLGSATAQANLVSFAPIV